MVVPSQFVGISWLPGGEGEGGGVGGVGGVRREVLQFLGRVPLPHNMAEDMTEQYIRRVGRGEGGLCLAAV